MYLWLWEFVDIGNFRLSLWVEAWDQKQLNLKQKQKQNETIRKHIEKKIITKQTLASI